MRNRLTRWGKMFVAQPGPYRPERTFGVRFAPCWKSDRPEKTIDSI